MTQPIPTLAERAELRLAAHQRLVTAFGTYWRGEMATASPYERQQARWRQMLADSRGPTPESPWVTAESSHDVLTAAPH